MMRQIISHASLAGGSGDTFQDSLSLQRQQQQGGQPAAAAAANPPPSLARRPVKPLAWLEWAQAAGFPQRLEEGAKLHLRCLVAANPLAQNTILQIEWLKDGRRLASSQRLQVEKANHLHMPPPQQQADQLAGASKLLAASSLSVERLDANEDSGLYTCHFKLIPAPSSARNPQQQAQLKIISGQANQTIQVNVIEGKPQPAPVSSARPHHPGQSPRGGRGGGASWGYNLNWPLIVWVNICRSPLLFELAPPIAFYGRAPISGPLAAAACATSGAN